MTTSQLYPLDYMNDVGDSGNTRSPLIDAKIGFTSALLLTLLSMILVFASIRNIGNFGLMAVMGLVFLMGLRRPSDIVLIWLTFFYNPELLAGSGFSNFKITVAISFLICFIYSRFSIQRLLNKATLGFVVFLVWLLLAVIIASDKSEAFSSYWLMIKSGIIMVLMISLVATEEDLGRALKWWAIIAAMSLVPSVVHYLLGPNTWLYEVYEVTRLRMIEKGSVQVGGDTSERLLWAGLDANGRGATLLFPFGIALAYLMCSDKKMKLFWAVVLGSIAVCILGSFSRSTFLCLVILLSLFTLTVSIRAIIPLFFMYFVGAFAVMLIPSIRDRILSIGENIAESGGTGRLYYWHQALYHWKASPLIGNGLRSFWITDRQEVHNTYLELLSDTGFIGCIIFTVLMGMACLWAFNSTKNRDDISPIFGKILGCGMVGLCAMMGTVMQLYEMTLWMTFTACFLIFHFRNTYHMNLNYQLTEQTTLEHKELPEQY